MNLCPYCLNELPDDYPYDHVAIDLALQGRARVYGDERLEALRIGVARGGAVSIVGRLLGMSNTTVNQVVRHQPRPIRLNDDDIRRLHATGASDVQIGRELGRHYSVIQRARTRLGLPSLYGPAGRRVRQEVA